MQIDTPLRQSYPVLPDSDREKHPSSLNVLIICDEFGITGVS
jgi:hypothetical protein